MDEQNLSEYRFARYVSQTAPMSGHHLATASFHLREEMMIFWVVEGPQNDAFSLMGMATNFERTRLLSYGFYGSLFERLNQMAPSPYAHGLRLRFTSQGGGPAPLPVQEAIAVFSGVRATDRPDPDSAAVAYQLGDAHGNGQVLAAITGYQRGWFLPPVLVAVGLSLGVELDQTLAGPQAPTKEQVIWLGVEADRGGLGALIDVQGTVTTRASLFGS
jgi:hypothetical protein